MTNMKKNKQVLLPFSDPAQIDFIKAQTKSIDRLIKRLKYSEGRLRNIETFLDGETKIFKGKFVKIDLEYMDEE